MSKEKVLNLTKYANELKSKLESKNLPDKQKDRPVQYKQFLNNELKSVTSKIDLLKSLLTPDSKK
jgi:hypothetical protein